MNKETIPIRNFDLMHKRLGLDPQDDRMIRDKRKTLDKVLLYSYQAEVICKVDEIGIAEYRALINPDKITNDYDMKVLSIGFEHNYHNGDVFYWKATDTYWLVYLQELTENAYFRAQIRRCNYQIQWVDENANKQMTWAYIRGPVEVTMTHKNFKENMLDTPNYSLCLYVPNNEINLKKFTRYSYFMFNGKTWRVVAADDISTDGIIEFYAQENYNNEVTSDVEEDLTDAFKIVPVISEKGAEIDGDTEIKPTLAYKYKIDKIGTWSIVEDKRPVTLSVQNGEAIIVWNNLKSGTFTLRFTADSGEIINKTIIVTSLF